MRGLQPMGKSATFGGRYSLRDCISHRETSDW